VNHRFVCFGPEDMTQWWGFIAPLLVPAVAKCEHDTDMLSIHSKIVSGHSMAAGMIVEDELVLALVMDRASYDCQTWLNLSLIGGRHLDVFAEHYWPLIKEFALRAGCAGVQCFCGPAEERLFRRFDRKREARRAYTVLRTGV
jgi:hypothetical protein